MWGLETSFLCFSDGQPLLASGGSSGVISIWNLEKRKLQSVVREAHDSSIVSLHFFPNEPVLMSSSADNSIKVRSISVSAYAFGFCFMILNDQVMKYQLIYYLCTYTSPCSYFQLPFP